MITPGVPAVMFAIHDEKQDLYCGPFNDKQDAQDVLDSCFGHMTEAQRARSGFVACPVHVTITPAPPVEHARASELQAELELPRPL